MYSIRAANAALRGAESFEDFRGNPFTWGTQTAARSTRQLAHEDLTRLARQRACADAEEGRWLLAALRNATHVHLGFASFNE